MSINFTSYSPLVRVLKRVQYYTTLADNYLNRLFPPFPVFLYFLVREVSYRPHRTSSSLCFSPKLELLLPPLSRKPWTST